MQINRLIAGTARPYTKPSGLRWMVARMISTNSLAAFAQEVNRTRPQTVEPVQLRTPGSPSSRAADSPQQRMLEAVPPAPSKPLPRGSLLDLRA